MKTIRRSGFGVLEVVLAMAIVAALLVPSMALFRRYRLALALNSAAAVVTAGLDAAREAAVARRVNVRLVVDGGVLSIVPDDGRPVDRPVRLPAGVLVEQKTAGMDPAVFLPDGSAEQAGRLVLREPHTGARKTVILYNLTGSFSVQ